MVGGELQLALNFDAQDVYFTFRPELSFYQKVYRRYGRFAIESKELIPNSGGNDLHNDSDTIINFKIPFNDGVYDGDLLKSVYLSVDLPNIYSGFLEIATTSYIKDLPQDFLWIKELGTYLVKNAKLKIGGNTIQELHDEYQDVWKELNLTKEEKKQYNIMTGNTPDMYNPSSVNGNQSFSNISPVDFISNPIFIGTDFTFTEIRNKIPYGSNIPSNVIVFYDSFDAVFQPSSQDNQKYIQYSSSGTFGGIPTITLGANSSSGYCYIPPNSELTYNYNDISKFKFSKNTYTKFYINKGNITFDANDSTIIDTEDDHFSKQRITAYGGDNHSYILYKANERTFLAADGSSLPISYTDSIKIQFYNKEHFTPFIFNYTNKTFERTDGLSHGYNTSLFGPIEVNIIIDEDVNFEGGRSNYVVNSTDSTFQILSVDEDGGQTATNGELRKVYINALLYTFDITTNVFEIDNQSSHPLVNDDIITWNDSGVFINFINGSSYYVVNATTNTFQLALTFGGSPITYSGNQTTISINGSYENFIFKKDTVLDSIVTPRLQFERIDGLNHGFSNGDTFYFYTLSEFISDINTYTLYTVINATNTSFQITTLSLFNGGTSGTQWGIAIGGSSHYMYNPTTHYFKLENGQNHTFSNDDRVQFNNSSIGVYWPPFSAITEYYVINVDTVSTPHQFQLSLTQGGPAITTTQTQLTVSSGINYIYNTTNDTFERTDGAIHSLNDGDNFSFTTVSYLLSYNRYYPGTTYIIKLISTTVFKLLSVNIIINLEQFLYNSSDDTFSRSDGSAHGLTTGNTIQFSQTSGPANRNSYYNSTTYTIESVTSTTFRIVNVGTDGYSYSYNSSNDTFSRSDGSAHGFTTGYTFQFSKTVGSAFRNNYYSYNNYKIESVTSTTFRIVNEGTDGNSYSYNSSDDTFSRSDGSAHGFTTGNTLEFSQTVGSAYSNGYYSYSPYTIESLTSTTFRFVNVGTDSNSYSYNSSDDTFFRSDGSAHGLTTGNTLEFSQTVGSARSNGYYNSTYIIESVTSTTFRLSGGNVGTDSNNYSYNSSDDTFSRSDGSAHGLTTGNTVEFSQTVGSARSNGYYGYNTYTILRTTDYAFRIVNTGTDSNNYSYNSSNDTFFRSDGSAHGLTTGNTFQFSQTVGSAYSNNYYPGNTYTIESVTSTTFRIVNVGTDTNSYLYNSSDDTFFRSDGSAHGLTTGNTFGFLQTVGSANRNGYYSSFTYTIESVTSTTFRIANTISNNVNYYYDSTNNNFYRADSLNHGFSNGNSIEFSTVSNFLIPYYSISTSYFVTNINTSVTPHTFQLSSSSGGTPISITFSDNNLLISLLPKQLMWNPETFFWKREDNQNHGFSNGDLISFTQQGTGYQSIFSLSTTYYVINKTDTTFQLSLTNGGSVIQRGSTLSFIPTTIMFDGKLIFNTTTNSFQRKDGLPHGITENEGVQLDLTNPEFENINWSTMTNGYIQNITDHTPRHYITISAKNVTNTTLQLYIIDLQNNNEYLFSPVNSLGNVVLSEFSISSFMSEVTLNLETTSNLLSTSDTTVNVDKNNIEFITPLINLYTSSLSSHTFSNNHKSYRPTKPIGFSQIEGGTTGNKVPLFIYFNIDKNEISFYDQKFITNHYPYARRFDGNNLMKTEKNFSSFYNASYYIYDVEATVDKNTTYIEKQTSGFNIIDNGLDSIGDDVLPSIAGRTLKIPLYFYFQRDIRKALPLIALNNTNPGVEFEITLRPIKDLYLSRFSPIVESEEAFWNQVPYEIQNSVGYYIKNNDEFKTSGIQFFLGNNDTSTNTKISGTELTKDLISFSINTKLEYNVIYLDKNERDRLIQPGCKRYFFINNAIRETFLNKNSNENQLEISLKINKPLKEILFIPKRSDVKYLNQWDNFTNYVVSNLPTTSNTYAWGAVSTTEFGYTTLRSQNNFPEYSYGGAINYSSICKLFNSTTKTFPYPSSLLTYREISKEFYDKNIIKEIEIKSTNDPFKKRVTLLQSGTYYENQQISEYYKKKSKDGIYLYSFSLNPLHDIPTGEKYKDFNTTANKDFNITIKLTDKPNKDNYDVGYEGARQYSEQKLVDEYIHEVNVYYVVYDILEIVDGTAQMIEYEDVI